MTISQIESNIKNLIKSFSKERFIYDFLLSYGLPKSSITRLQKGSLNLSQNKNELIWKKKLFFRIVNNNDLHLSITEMLQASKYNERFIIATDYSTILAIDTKTSDRLDIEFNDLLKHYDFFLPWAGIEKSFHQDENPADVKAAVKMAKLFDDIRKDNPNNSPDFLHNLNVFLSRLLFCFFAEDTNIFEEGQFTNSIDSHTLEDGSDLNNYFDRLFEVFNTPEDKRKSLPEFLNNFPYVNGGLFRDKIVSPKFTKSSRRAILDSGDQDWSAINPDIFGSMFQAAVSEEQRTNLGQHYTSVPNIMKVIKPLFLDDLYETFKKNENNPQKLNDLLKRLGKIKIFDPACGSGNFLIIAYKELRRLEIKIIQQLLLLQKQVGSFDPKREQLSFIPKSQMSLASSFQVDLFSRIQLNNFYGIEIDDFAHEITKLSLWLAEHQMNTEFLAVFGKTNPTLPLKEAGNIVCANACRIDWEKVCCKEKADEIFVLGNPPYLGARVQETHHKADMAFVFKSFKKYGDLDYIACWFYKGAYYIANSNAKLAFVSTNSICQGIQVGLLWPSIFEMDIEIYFAHTSFKWSNNAKYNAGVTVVIVGLSNQSNDSKTIHSDILVRKVNRINVYLISGNNSIIHRRSNPLSDFPEMSFGSMPNEGGNLIFNSQSELKTFLSEDPKVTKFIKEMYGGEDFIYGCKRYCLWIDEKNENEAKKFSIINERIKKVRNYRLESKRNATRKLAEIPYRFGENRYKEEDLIIIPATSSENREFIPIGFLKKGTVVNNAAQVIYNPQPWLLAVLTSKLHMIWLITVGGKLEERVRYSKDIVYNTFPFPQISDQRKQELTQTTFRILEEREKHPAKTLAELYNPDKMPEGLKEAHRLNDLAVERCYRSKPFDSDEERLEYLFRLYEQMIEEENERDTLFAKEKKPRKRKKK
ncbi:MAG: class I SAM-dependent DNA methyltransferase [Ignavibacterium sp.]|nr:class I SAM-dependent DNA methyltransferase [Ignavibacterium sp.]